MTCLGLKIISLGRESGLESKKLTVTYDLQNNGFVPPLPPWVRNRENTQLLMLYPTSWHLIQMQIDPFSVYKRRTALPLKSDLNPVLSVQSRKSN